MRSVAGSDRGSSGDRGVPPASAPAETPAVGVVRGRLDELRARIVASGRDPGDVTIVAVTKGFGPAVVAVALEAGLVDLGENYAAELLTKAAVFAPGRAGAPGPRGGRGDPSATGPARWHYLGAVQRRRVRHLAPVVAVWHGVARVVEAEAIAAAAPGAAVFVQVDTSGIPGRNGCVPAEVEPVVDASRRAGLDVRGLMVVAPPGPPEVARGSFRLVAALAREFGLSELSMGMSGDVDVALEEGATTLRVGRALFGERPPRGVGRA